MISLNDLGKQARAVLTENRANGSTKPSPDLYPHQWMWDSCFIAVGLSRYDPQRAEVELHSLLRGQWRNGMVPQIVFNPTASGYFPGPDTWQSDRSVDAPPAVRTSGITQPPILATAALKVYEADPDRGRAEAFVSDVYPRILAYHRFLYRERNPDGSGLIVVVHPWESGLDNSPPYLDAGSRVNLTYRPAYRRLDTLHVSAANRPSDRDYDLYIWLLEQMRAVDYDWGSYLPKAQLQVEDVLFNAILCRANRDLARLAEIDGKDATEISAWLEQTSAAVNHKLWDDEKGGFFSFDRVANRLLSIDTVAGLTTLFGLDLSKERQGRVLETLLDESKFWPKGGFASATTGLDSSWFDRQNYWRGPVWININWLLIEGLVARGQLALAQRLKTETLELVRRSGFREYFDPFSGEGYGTDRFSWTAALIIDLLDPDPVRYAS